MNRNLLGLALFFAAASLPLGCAEILGTSGYKPCSDDGEGGAEPCEDGGSGGGTTTDDDSTSGSSSGSSGSSTATECFDVTVVVTGSVKVRLAPIDMDFEPGFSGPVCVPAGPITLSAECDASGGDDPPVAVSWGNDACVDDMPSCAFTLTEDEDFEVDADDDCP